MNRTPRTRTPRRRSSVSRARSTRTGTRKSEITVRRAIEQWLEVVDLEDSTRERYDDLIRLYVLPTFGALPAARPDAELLERFYARLHRCRVLSCNGKSRSGSVRRGAGASAINPDPISADNGGRVEIYPSEDEATARRDRIQELARTLPIAVEYDYVSGPVLVRVPKTLTPDQAKQYGDALGGS